MAHGLFFAGALAGLTGVASSVHAISGPLVSVLLFCFGAIFLFFGIAAAPPAPAEVKKTLHGLIPICMGCKMIRSADRRSNDPETWERLEVFISARADVKFSHGYCPECSEQVLSRMETMGKEA